MSFDEVLADFPLELINSKPPHTPYSFWHFMEHIRISQWDILEFIRTPNHISPKYPEGYRPRPSEKTDANGWHKSIAGFRSDLAALQEIVRDRKIDLCAPLPHARDYTVFREIVLAADHNAYHIGEFAVLRQVMGSWPRDRAE